jgi:hypothetical protein
MRRAAGICGLVGFVTFNVGWIAGDLVQRLRSAPPTTTSRTSARSPLTDSNR